MKKIALKQIYHEGITMQIPEIWKAEKEVYDEADGTKSYSLSIAATGKDIRSIDISIGMIPEGSDAYIEASRTYEVVVSEEDLKNNEEPILGFKFQDYDAYGFDIWTEDGLPCFFFCIDVQSKGVSKLLTVLVTAQDNDKLEDMMDFVEEYLEVD